MFKKSPPFLLLAPMEGVVDVVIRHMISELGGVDRLVTEFVRVTERLLPDHVFYKYCPELLSNKGFSEHGLPVFVQLLGGNASVIAENAARVVELGAQGIDLNFGCPAKTVNRHDGGATLLKNPERLFDIISAVKRAVAGRVPVTAKVRLGFADKSLVREIAQAVDSAGAAYMTVHARTKFEGYAPPAHWHFIREMKECISIPVIANGDIWSVEDYLRCVEISGCENVALGRGLMSRPTLANEIKSYLAKQNGFRNQSVIANNFETVGSADSELKTRGFLVSSPSNLVDGEYLNNSNWNYIAGVYLPKFVDLTLRYRGENYTIPLTKQLLKFLSREYTEARELFERVKVCLRLSELQPIMDSLVELQKTSEDKFELYSFKRSSEQKGILERA